MAKADEVDAALLEDDVGERRFSELGARQAAAPQLDPADREPNTLAAGPVHVAYDGVDEVTEFAPARCVIVEVGRVRRDRRRGHAG